MMIEPPEKEAEARIPGITAAGHDGVTRPDSIPPLPESQNEQTKAPIYEALMSYKKKRVVPFDVSRAKETPNS